MLLVVGAIRNNVNQLDLNQSADAAMESIKTLLKPIRFNDFIQSDLDSGTKPNSSVSQHKATTLSNVKPYLELIDEFIQSNRAERISLRSINQLEL
ncbi:hypothetical protein KP803_01405 [Vibrio sp. ZSDE26]|uniref:Uncharacterized protein n=1 Tax=Vibrio amylolyticus TaxID=2847292 RepID=A0A9X1XGN2_9VIBR|nr:hypothetical protein [Vibrio amylolyticus]MCK6261926.1 hypothetical protein [Vibrio amylolyticus]